MKFVQQIGQNSAQACIAMITHTDLETVKKYCGGESDVSYKIISEALNNLGIKTGELIIRKSPVIPDELPLLCMCLQHYGSKHDIHWVVWCGKENIWYDPNLGIVYKSRYNKENWHGNNLPVITSYFEILTVNISIFNIIDAQKVKDYATGHGGTLRAIADWAAKEWPDRGIEAGNQIEGHTICQEAAEMLNEYMWNWF